VAQAQEYQQNTACHPDCDVQHGVYRMIGWRTLLLEGFWKLFGIGECRINHGSNECPVEDLQQYENA